MLEFLVPVAVTIIILFLLLPLLLLLMLCGVILNMSLISGE